MELATVIFPILAIIKHERIAQKTKEALDAFDTKQKNTGSTSMISHSTGSKRSGHMFSSESLDECLTGTYITLQTYASNEEFNGENIAFLVKTLSFKDTYRKIMSSTANLDPSCARTSIFRAALAIFMSLVHTETAYYNFKF